MGNRTAMLSPDEEGQIITKWGEGIKPVLTSMAAVFGELKMAEPGTWSEGEFNCLLGMLGATNRGLTHLIFRAIDENHDGKVPVFEGVKALLVLTRGTVDERLLLAFRMIDVEHKNLVTREEVEAVIVTLSQSLISLGVKPPEIETARFVSQLCDIMTDDEDMVSFDSYRTVCLANPCFVRSFGVGSPKNGRTIVPCTPMELETISVTPIIFGYEKWDFTLSLMLGVEMGARRTEEAVSKRQRKAVPISSSDGTISPQTSPRNSPRNSPHNSPRASPLSSPRAIASRPAVTSPRSTTAPSAAMRELASPIMDAPASKQDTTDGDSEPRLERRRRRHRRTSSAEFPRSGAMHPESPTDAPPTATTPTRHHHKHRHHHHHSVTPPTTPPVLAPSPASSPAPAAVPAPIPAPILTSSPSTRTAPATPPANTTNAVAPKRPLATFGSPSIATALAAAAVSMSAPSTTEAARDPPRDPPRAPAAAAAAAVAAAAGVPAGGPASPKRADIPDRVDGNTPDVPPRRHHSRQLSGSNIPTVNIPNHDGEDSPGKRQPHRRHNSHSHHVHPVGDSDVLEPSGERSGGSSTTTPGERHHLRHHSSTGNLVDTVREDSDPQKDTLKPVAQPAAGKYPGLLRTFSARLAPQAKVDTPTSGSVGEDGSEMMADSPHGRAERRGRAGSALTESSSSDVCSSDDDEADPNLVRQRDYAKKVRYSLPSKAKPVFTEYAPVVFRAIRACFGIDTDAYVSSIGIRRILGALLLGELGGLSEMHGAGKSGAFFYLSNDGRFFVKTISAIESHALQTMLPSYYEHVRTERRTLLTKYCGLYKLKLGMSVYRFIVMTNVFHRALKISEKFDLKGSTYGRTVGRDNMQKPGMILKDLDFIAMHRQVHVGPALGRALMDQLSRDVAFLVKNEIVDYSLLVGIHKTGHGIDSATWTAVHQHDLERARDALLAHSAPTIFQRLDFNEFCRFAFEQSDVQAGSERTQTGSSGWGSVSSIRQTETAQVRGEEVYYLGIIDALIPFQFRKIAEYKLKSALHDAQAVSVIPPSDYGPRFLHFMSQVFGLRTGFGAEGEGSK